MLNMSKTVEQGKAVYVLTGRLDTVTSPLFEKEIRENLEGITELVVDMADLEYVSSAGLRVLLFAQRFMNRQGSMKLIHVSEGILDVFRVTGFMSFLDIETEED